MHVDAVKTLSLYGDCVEVLNNPKILRPNPYDVAKCFLSNAHMTCQALLQGRLSKLDPIVGENACQVRALLVLIAYLTPEVREELKTLDERVNALLKTLNEMVNAQRKSVCKFYKEEAALEEQLAQLKLCITVSERVDYLLRCHLLTIGKHFSISRDGTERCWITVQTIKDRLKTQISNEVLEPIIHHARQKMSQHTVRYLQEEARKLRSNGCELVLRQLQQERIRMVIARPLTHQSSCAFYNIKAVVMRVCELGIPILIKEHLIHDQNKAKLRADTIRINPIRFYFRGAQAGGSLIRVNPPEDPLQPLLVVEGFFPEKQTPETIAAALDQRGAWELILANAAGVLQFSADDVIDVLEQEAKDEIQRYRILGEKLGCQTATPAVFSIAHIHASTHQEEKGVKTDTKNSLKS